MAQNRLQAERIDIFNNIRPMSYNVPGHEKRMKALEAKVEKEYFDSGLHRKEMSWSQMPNE